MKNSIWKAVGIPFEIKSIEGKNMSDAVVVAFSSNEYCFFGSCWFIDVKNRFRIFKFGDVSYIAKETSEVKADLEVANSNQALDKLNGLTVGKKFVKIVVPKKVKSLHNSERCYLVSEYFGLDMNNNTYVESGPKILLNECFSIVKLLLDNGISYRGFLPRNIISKDNFLYLFDWEDATFKNAPDFGSFDHLWRTNFLLNWSYVFDFSDLVEGLKDVLEINEQLNEPELVKYEKTFKNMTKILASDSVLRKEIDKIVFGSELPLVGKQVNFYIHPNDMGHLIADLFSSEIDVLHDILSYSFRKNDEYKFLLHIQLTTHLLISFYKSVLIYKCNPTFRIQHYVLISILMMTDRHISEKEYESILSTNGLEEIVAKIEQVSSERSITKMFLLGKTDNLSKLLENGIKKALSKICPEIESKEFDTFDKVKEFILAESSDGHVLT
jgi:hypothetical protein